MKFDPQIIERKLKRKNKINKITQTLFYIVIVPVIIYNISLIIQSFMIKDETPSFLGYKTYVIVSGSMSPELNIGDIVVVKKVSQKEIKTGEIISFREGMSIVTHRIKEVINEENEILYKTKGDNNNTEDNSLVEYGQIEGIYVTHIEKVGYLIIFLKNKIVIISIVLILLIIYSYKMKKQRKSIKRRQKREEYEERKLNENIQEKIEE